MNFPNIFRTRQVYRVHRNLASSEPALLRIAFCFQSFSLSTSWLHLEIRGFIKRSTRKIAKLTIILFTKARPFHIDYVLFFNRPLQPAQRPLIFCPEVLFDVVRNAMVQSFAFDRIFSEKFNESFKFVSLPATRNLRAW